jgi:hypothetical protein
MQPIRITNLRHNCPKEFVNRALYKHVEMYEAREDMCTQKYRIRFTVTQTSQSNTSPRT